MIKKMNDEIDRLNKLKEEQEKSLYKALMKRLNLKMPEETEEEEEDEEEEEEEEIEEKKENEEKE